jgi:hypothetical protein
MAILYVASEAAELKPLAEMLTGLRKLSWPIDYAYEGVHEGRRILLAANGAGPRLAEKAVEVAIRAVTAADLSASKLEAVVSTGWCGALDPALKEKQILIATEILNLAGLERYECAGGAREEPLVRGNWRAGCGNGGCWCGCARKASRITFLLHQSSYGPGRGVFWFGLECHAKQRGKNRAWENHSAYGCASESSP